MHMVIAKHKWEILPRQCFLSSHGIQSIARIMSWVTSQKQKNQTINMY